MKLVNLTTRLKAFHTCETAGCAEQYLPRAQTKEGRDSKCKTVLASQFVSGLLPEQKQKVVGTGGTIEQLLVKARYEEAKLWDFPRTPEKRNEGPGRESNRGGPHNRGDQQREGHGDQQNNDVFVTIRCRDEKQEFGWKMSHSCIPLYCNM